MGRGNVRKRTLEKALEEFQKERKKKRKVSPSKRPLRSSHSVTLRDIHWVMAKELAQSEDISISRTVGGLIEEEYLMVLRQKNPEEARILKEKLDHESRKVDYFAAHSHQLFFSPEWKRESARKRGDIEGLARLQGRDRPGYLEEFG